MPVLRRAPFAVILAIQLVIAVLLAEGLLLTMYRHPAAWYPAGLRRFLTTEYFNRRNIVQLDERHARYDPELFYTLEPGAFMFSNPEFSTQFVVNRIGVRDNQRSLEQPEIVVAGDSYAMGWGVQQDESFPELIERRTGRRVLNAAMSSYGTVRERRMLDRDRSEPHDDAHRAVRPERFQRERRVPETRQPVHPEQPRGLAGGDRRTAPARAVLAVPDGLRQRGVDQAGHHRAAAGRLRADRTIRQTPRPSAFSTR